MLSLGNTLRWVPVIHSCRALLNPCRPSVPLCNSYSAAKSLEEKVGLPPKPKRPLTPYFRYMRDIRPTVIAENPQANTLEVVKIIAKKWENVDEITKKKLNEEYKKDQMLYVERRAKYDSKISPQKKDEMKQLKVEMAEAKEKKEIKKKVKELGRPKKPASAFLRYLVKERAASPQGPNQTYKEWQIKAAEKWSRMSDDEKNVFIQASRKDLEKYKQELSKWEDKMVRLGHIDVVRNESLIDPPASKPRRKTVKPE